jgi:hypothetical protein
MTFYICSDEPFFIKEHLFLEIEYRGKASRQKFYILPKVRAEKILVERETINLLMDGE